MPHPLLATLPAQIRGPCRSILKSTAQHIDHMALMPGTVSSQSAPAGRSAAGCPHGSVRLWPRSSRSRQPAICPLSGTHLARRRNCRPAALTVQSKNKGAQQGANHLNRAFYDTANYTMCYIRRQSMVQSACTTQEGLSSTPPVQRAPSCRSRTDQRCCQQRCSPRSWPATYTYHTSAFTHHILTPFWLMHKLHKLAQKLQNHTSDKTSF